MTVFGCFWPSQTSYNGFRSVVIWEGGHGGKWLSFSIGIMFSNICNWSQKQSLVMPEQPSAMIKITKVSHDIVWPGLDSSTWPPQFPSKQDEKRTSEIWSRNQMIDLPLAAVEYWQVFDASESWAWALLLENESDEILREFKIMGRKASRPKTAQDNCLRAMMSTLSVRASNEFWLHSRICRRTTEENYKSTTSRSNYCSIAISGILGKILDHIILRNHNDVLRTSELQFGFKQHHSTTQSTFVVKEILIYYSTNQTPVFVMFLGASKAFDGYIIWSFSQCCQIEKFVPF